MNYWIKPTSCEMFIISQAKGISHQDYSGNMMVDLYIRKNTLCYSINPVLTLWPPHLQIIPLVVTSCKLQESGIKIR